MQALLLRAPYERIADRLAALRSAGGADEPRHDRQQLVEIRFVLADPRLRPEAGDGRHGLEAAPRVR